MLGLEEKISDGKVLSLVQAFLDQKVMDGLDELETSEGTPQGSVISPLLANIALHRLDLLAEKLGHQLVRYADDFVILCEDGNEASSALAAVKDWTEKNGLTLHPDKTRILDYGARESFDFLGYTFRQGSVFPRKKSLKNFRDKIRDKTPRNSGKSLVAIIEELNPILRGWHGYFKASKAYVFSSEDSFVRGRLRALLARRNGKYVWLRAASSKRWPNTYFEKQGLISMKVLAQRRSS